MQEGARSIAGISAGWLFHFSANVKHIAALIDAEMTDVEGICIEYANAEPTVARQKRNRNVDTSEEPQRSRRCAI